RLVGNLKRHQAKLEKLLDENVDEFTLLVHFFDQRTQLVIGKQPNVVAGENFIFREGGQRSRGGKLQGSIGHVSAFRRNRNEILALWQAGRDWSCRLKAWTSEAGGTVVMRGAAVVMQTSRTEGGSYRRIQPRRGMRYLGHAQERQS